MDPDNRRRLIGVSLWRSARELSTTADIEQLDTYEKNLQGYEEQDYSYVPIPSEDLYYDRKNEQLRDLHPNQFIDAGATLREVIYRLQEYPFLLIDRASDLTVYLISEEQMEYELLPEDVPPDAEEIDADEVEESYPTIQKELNFVGRNRYEIITLADLNRRMVRESLFPVIATVEDILSEIVRDDVNNSKSLYPQLPPRIIGRREKDKLNDTEVHIVEYLGLIDLKKLLKGRPHLLDEAGFASPSKCEEKLGSLNQLRNKVMHTNRTLVHDQSDAEKILNRVDIAQEIIANYCDSDSAYLRASPI